MYCEIHSYHWRYGYLFSSKICTHGNEQKSLQLSMSSTKWRPFRSGFNVLNASYRPKWLINISSFKCKQSAEQGFSVVSTNNLVNNITIMVVSLQTWHATTVSCVVHRGTKIEWCFFRNATASNIFLSLSLHKVSSDVGNTFRKIQSIGKFNETTTISIVFQVLPIGATLLEFDHMWIMTYLPFVKCLLVQVTILKWRVGPFWQDTIDMLPYTKICKRNWLTVPSSDNPHINIPSRSGMSISLLCNRHPL